MACSTASVTGCLPILLHLLRAVDLLYCIFNWLLTYFNASVIVCWPILLQMLLTVDLLYRIFYWLLTCSTASLTGCWPLILHIVLNKDSFFAASFSGCWPVLRLLLSINLFICWETDFFLVLYLVLSCTGYWPYTLYLVRIIDFFAVLYHDIWQLTLFHVMTIDLLYYIV